MNKTLMGTTGTDTARVNLKRVKEGLSGASLAKEVIWSNFLMDTNTLHWSSSRLRRDVQAIKGCLEAVCRHTSEKSVDTTPLLKKDYTHMHLPRSTTEELVLTKLNFQKLPN